MTKYVPTAQCVLGVCPRDPHDECSGNHCHQQALDQFDTDNGHDRDVEDWHGKAKGGYTP
jgi:hypothetical protein